MEIFFFKKFQKGFKILQNTFNGNAMDHLQEIDQTLEENKDTLQRLRNVIGFETSNMLSEAKSKLDKGYPVYGLVEINGKTKNVQLLDPSEWTQNAILIKLQNGTEKHVPYNSIKLVK